VTDVLIFGGWHLHYAGIFSNRFRDTFGGAYLELFQDTALISNRETLFEQSGQPLAQVGARSATRREVIDDSQYRRG